MRWSEPTYTGNVTAELERLKSWCNVHEDDTVTDADIHEAALWACDEVGGIQRRQLIAATFTVYADDWPDDGTICFRDKLPITAVSAVKYKDGDGVLQTVDSSNYHTSIVGYNSPARIVPITGYSWPTLQSGAVDRVQLSVTAGYPTVEQIPMPTRGAIRYLVAQKVAAREPVVIGSISSEIPLTLRTAIQAGEWGWYG